MTSVFFWCLEVCCCCFFVFADLFVSFRVRLVAQDPRESTVLRERV